jgi:hypothetical protein
MLRSPREAEDRVGRRRAAFRYRAGNSVLGPERAERVRNGIFFALIRLFEEPLLRIFA